MKRRLVRRAAWATVVSATAVTIAAAPSGASPTCAGIGALQNHGQHIVGDYVTAIGGISGDLAWPPSGVVGRTIGGAGGADKPGTPGLPHHGGFAPGASFCVDSSSPGVHL